MKQRYRVATAAYPIDQLESWADYVAKLTRWTEDAARAGAALLVFPEYGAMELAAIDGVGLDLAASIDAVSRRADEIDDLHSRLAARCGAHILGASLPVRLKDGRAVNRARLFAPSGSVGVQDKRVMTRFEREEWRISGGDRLTAFETELGVIGVAICYDAEFPLISRALTEQGAELLLVPSCTDSLRGWARVRIGAMARALENQCYAVQSPTVGDAPWSAAVDINVGAAGVYAPPDHGFPADGVVAQGGLDAPGWLYADIDLDRVAQARADGAVLLTRHWPEQIAPVERKVL